MRDIRILIADDDAGMRLVMRKIVEKSEGCILAGEAKDGGELIAMYDETQPDVVLMDVEMPVMTGVECAKIIQDKNPRTVLIFATAHEEYMKSAFEVYAFDYLVKPFKLERALGTLQRIRERLSGEMENRPVTPRIKPAAKRLVLHHREGVSFIDLSDIVLIQREDRSTVVYTENGEKYVTSDTLSEMDERLPDDMFFRTHKSYIVSLSHIDSISPYGRWTYVIKFRGSKLDALVTYEKYEELQRMFE